MPRKLDEAIGWEERVEIDFRNGRMITVFQNNGYVFREKMALDRERR